MRHKESPQRPHIELSIKPDCWRRPFASTATKTTQSGASNCAEGSCLLCEGRFSPRELYRMFFWSRQGKQQQLCASSWGREACIRVCGGVCALVSSSVCWICVCVCVCLPWAWIWQNRPHWKHSPGNYKVMSSIHKKKEEKNIWLTEWSTKWLWGRKWEGKQDRRLNGALENHSHLLDFVPSYKPTYYSEFCEATDKHKTTWELQGGKNKNKVML